MHDESTLEVGPDTPPVHRVSRRPLWVIGLGLVAVAAAWFASQAFRGHEPPMGERHPLVGTRWEPKLFSPLTGVTVPLEPDRLRGKAVLMNFWGTWCYPCRLELPELVAMVRELRSNEQFRFVSVACEDGVPINELASKTEQFLIAQGYDDIVTYTDASMANRASLALLAGTGDSFYYPTTIILDQNSVIRGLWVGLEGSDPAPVIAAQRRVLEQLLRAAP